MNQARDDDCKIVLREMLQAAVFPMCTADCRTMPACADDCQEMVVEGEMVAGGDNAKNACDLIMRYAVPAFDQFSQYFPLGGFILNHKYIPGDEPANTSCPRRRFVRKAKYIPTIAFTYFKFSLLQTANLLVFSALQPQLQKLKISFCCQMSFWI